jgi:hypothetical protein
LADAFCDVTGYQYLLARESLASMAIPVSPASSGALRPGPRAFAPLAVVIAIALCGCSINLGSLSPEP